MRVCVGVGTCSRLKLLFWVRQRMLAATQPEGVTWAKGRSPLPEEFAWVPHLHGPWLC